MDPRFAELCEDRRAYVHIAKKNGFYEGLKQLLTRLYPDSAHFVYELLQNAEDAQAEEVHFGIFADRLEFEHDGKRLFDYADVEAITGISQSTKKDDGTSIGKFGIGFKSIYAYTSMPEIYSGEYRFSISDSFIPLPIRSSRQIRPGRTLFVLPFDNPDKDVSKAHSEIAEALRSLNFSSLLFLKNLKTIDYAMYEGEWGRIDRDEDGPFVKILCTGFENEKKMWTFLRYQKEVVIEEDSGALKVCNIGIAYKVNKSDLKNGQNEPAIVPMNRGLVSIYFPAAKETSNLKFNINAPFASTVARDGVRACPDNDKLRDALAELAVESIRAIRDLGMLNMKFLACLPSEKDDLPPFYEPIRQRIVQAFREEDLTPLRKGGHAPASILQRAPARISDVFPDARFAELMGLDDDRVWCANPPQKNQREDNFLDSLDMDEWSLPDLASLISNCDKAREPTSYFSRHLNLEENLLLADNLEKLITTFSDSEIYSFYALLGECIMQHDMGISSKNLKLIRVKDKSDLLHVTPAEAHLPSDGLKGDYKGVLFVKRETYEKQKAEKSNTNALAFLKNVGVRQYDLCEKVRLRLELYKTNNQPDEATHLNDMRLFIEYMRQGGDRMIFRGAYFILGQRDGESRWCAPSNISIEKPWQNTGISPIIKDMDWYFVASIYENEFGAHQDSRDDFSKFLLSLGCNHRLVIKQTSSIPWEIKCGMRNWGKITSYRHEVDYVIDGLENILANITMEKSLLVWKCLLEAQDWQDKCSYRPNASAATTTADATFIRKLKEAMWIPDKKGEFHNPGAITFEDINEKFFYKKENNCIKALDIGADIRELARQQTEDDIRRKEQDKQAREEGFASQVDKEECAELSRILREAGSSPKEAIEKLRPKTNKPEFPQRPVLDRGRRMQKRKERASQASNKSYESRQRSVRVSRGTVDPRSELRSLYTNGNEEMICQICHEEMPFRNRSGQSYFEAVELFDAELVDKEDEAMYIALCPTCAAKYKEFIKTDSKAMKDLLNAILEAESHKEEFSLELDGKIESLWFVEKHWFDIVTLLGTGDMEKMGE